MYPAHGQVVLGTANLGIKSTPAEANRILDAFADLGGELIDTAAVYSDWVPGERGRSERIIGDWLAGRSGSARPAVATKGGHPLLDDMATRRLDRAALTADVDDSLRRLRVEAIELYYLHRDDPRQPVEDILSILGDLVAAGKIVRIALSNWKTARVVAARASGIVPIASNQVRGSLLGNLAAPPRDPEMIALDADVLAEAEAGDQSVLLFSSQAGGILSKPATAVNANSAFATPAAIAAAAEIRSIAADLGADATVLSLRVLMNLSVRLFPVVGPNSVAQLERSMSAAALYVPPEIQRRLAALAGFRGWPGVGL